MKRQICGDTGDTRGGNRAPQACESDGAIRTVGDDLCQERVVKGRHPRARRDVSVHTDSLTLRPGNLPNQARTRAKIVRRIFRIYAALDCAAAPVDIGLREAQPHTRRNCDLLGNQIRTRHSFGHGMFDLDAGIHLEEVESIALAIDKELDGARATVRKPLGKPDCRLVQCPGQSIGKPGRRRFFDNFLVAPLRRAVALTEVNAIAVGVKQDLHLDVARSLKQLAAAQWIFTSPTGKASYAHRLFEQNGLVPPAPVAMVNSTLVLTTLISEGDYVGLMPMPLAMHSAAAAFMTVVPIKEGHLAMTVGVIVRRGASLKPAVRHFMAHLHRAAQQVRTSQGTAAQASSRNPSAPATLRTRG